MKRAAAVVAAALVCLAAGACEPGGSREAAPTPAPMSEPATGTATGTTGAPDPTGAAIKRFSPLPDCVSIVAHYPKGIYRSVGPYPGETGLPERDLQYRYCNTAGYAAEDGKVTLTTVITIYRPTTDPFRGIPVATWLPQRVAELVAERCARAAAWDGGTGGKRCSAGGSGGPGSAVVAGATGDAVLRAEVSGKLPRARLESAADRIARAVMSELT